jgi:hypothetical protein
MNDFQNTLRQVFANGLSKLVDKNPALSAITFAPDLQGQQVQFGGSVRIRVPIMKEADDFDPEVGFEGQATTYEKFDVTINQSKKVEFVINMGEASADANLAKIISDASEVVAASLGQSIMNSIIATANNAVAFPLQKTIAAPDFDYDQIVALGVAMDENLAFGERSIVINPTAYGEALLDDRVIASNANAGSNATRTGVLTDIAGFNVAKSTGVTKAGANFRGAALNKSALAFVPLIPIDLQAAAKLPKVAECGVYTDTETGISMYWQAWFDANKVKARIAAVLFYGVGACRKEGLIRITSAGADVLTVPEA